MANDVTHLYGKFGDDRLPLGQRGTQRFLVLSESGTSSWDSKTWSFEAWGVVGIELDLSFDEFRDLPVETQVQDFHCATDRSKFDCELEGVTFSTPADVVGVDNDTAHVMFRAMDSYTTNLSLDQYMYDEVMFAWGYGGEGLLADHGSPLRAIIPHKYVYKDARWVSGIEFLTEPERGY